MRYDQNFGYLYCILMYKNVKSLAVYIDFEGEKKINVFKIYIVNWKVAGDYLMGLFIMIRIQIWSFNLDRYSGFCHGFGFGLVFDFCSVESRKYAVFGFGDGVFRWVRAKANQY